MAIQEQFVLSKDPSTGTVLLPQSSNNTAFEIDNNGTGHGLYVNQEGVLDVDKYGLYVYSNAIQTSDYNLVRFHQHNASSTQTVSYIRNDGTGAGQQIQQIGDGDALIINNTGNKHGIYVLQDEVLAANRHALLLYSIAIQVNSPVAYFWQNHTSSTAGVLEIDNNGTGHGLYIHQDGVLATTKHGLLVQTAQDIVAGDSALVKFWSTGTGSSEPLLEFVQSSSTATSLLIQAYQYSGSANGITLQMVATAGTGIGVEIDNDGTGHGLYLHQDGNLASGKYALYIDNNGTPVDGAGRAIRLDGCTITSTKNPETDAEAGFIAINVDGTQMAVPYYALS